MKIKMQNSTHKIGKTRNKPKMQAWVGNGLSGENSRYGAMKV